MIVLMINKVMAKKYCLRQTNISLAVNGVVPMLGLILFFLVVSFSLLISLFLPIRVCIKVKINNKKIQIYLSAMFIGIKIYTKELYFNNYQQNEKLLSDILSYLFQPDSSKSKINTKNKLLFYFNQLKEGIDLLMNNITLHKFMWKTQFGIGDASITGVFSGPIWALKQTINIYINQIKHIQCQPTIRVIPNFQHSGLSSQFTCIFSMKLVKAITMLVKYSNVFKPMINK